MHRIVENKTKIKNRIKTLKKNNNFLFIEYLEKYKRKKTVIPIVNKRIICKTGKIKYSVCPINKEIIYNSKIIWKFFFINIKTYPKDN